MVRDQVSTRKFTPRRSSVIVEHTHEMHAFVKTFMETYFASYLHLG